MVPEDEVIAPQIAPAHSQVDVVLARYAPPEEVPARYPLLAAVGVACRLQRGDGGIEPSGVAHPNQGVENRLGGESRDRCAADMLDRASDAVRAQRGVDSLTLHLKQPYPCWI